MKKIYIVRLTPEERSSLAKMIKTGKAAAYKRLNAQILLKADISELGEGGWKDYKISEAFQISQRTVERVRQRLVEQGLDAAINRAKQKSVRLRKIDGEIEAHLIALTCGEPPEGRTRWTLRLLATSMVQLGYLKEVSYETVRRTLKKTN